MDRYVTLVAMYIHIYKKVLKNNNRAWQSKIHALVKSDSHKGLLVPFAPSHGG